MSTKEIARTPQGAGEAVAKQAPTEQQASQPGVPKRFEKGQTVCNEKNDKGKLCNGHLKQVSPIREAARKHMRGDDLLYRCQTCGALYAGPPLGHVRDPGKQARYVQSELVTILEAAGGTLPAFKQNATGAWVPVGETATHAPAPVAAAAQNIKPVTAKPKPSASTPAATDAASSDETPEQKRARIIAEAKAKAAARMAGGAPAKSEPSPAPPTPATGDAPSDETPEQKRARVMAEVKAKAAARMAGKGGAGGEATTPPPPATTPPAAAGSGEATVATPPATIAAPPVAPSLATAAAADVPSDDTPEGKRARLMADIKAKAAAKMAAKSNPTGAGATSIASPPMTAQPPSPTSGTDSSPAADAHRPAAEAQAATGQASAAPMSPAAATASPAAGAETVADLAPDASTELTPGAPKDESASE